MPNSANFQLCQSLNYYWRMLSPTISWRWPYYTFLCAHQINISSQSHWVLWWPIRSFGWGSDCLHNRRWVRPQRVTLFYKRLFIHISCFMCCCSWPLGNMLKPFELLSSLLWRHCRLLFTLPSCRHLWLVRPYLFWSKPHFPSGPATATEEPCSIHSWASFTIFFIVKVFD